MVPAVTFFEVGFAYFCMVFTSSGWIDVQDVIRAQ
jgi:hypothetical protein